MAFETGSTDFQFGVCAVVTIVYQLFFFLIAAYFRFDTVTDLAGGSNFVLLAALTWYFSDTSSNFQTAANLLVIVWGVRLSAFLFYRIIMINEDNRFKDIREDLCKFFGFWVFQMFWVYIVSLPLIFVNGCGDDGSNVQSLGEQEIIAISISVLGLLVESIADQTKFNFKQWGSSPKKWCTVSIWKYSRHPNYFGEIIFWWGFFLLCSSQMSGDNTWGFFTIISPCFITGLLLFLSGLPMLGNSWEISSLIIPYF